MISAYAFEWLNLLGRSVHVVVIAYVCVRAIGEP